MRRALLIVFSLFLLLPTGHASARAPQGQEVSRAGLAGTYLAPHEPGPHKGVLIIAGSGTTDRNGNSKLGVSAGSLKLLAEAFAASNIASLRYDKRGVGSSQGAAVAESDLRLSTFVNDARGWNAWLRKQTNIACVFLLGHSEGGLIATRVAGSSPPAGLMLIAAPGRTFGAVLADQLRRAPMPANERSDALAILEGLEAGRETRDVDPKLRNLFRPSVQPYLRSLVNVDPAALLAALPVPTLVVSGGQDLQVGEADFKALIRARTDLSTLRIPNMNHVLKDVSGDRAANLASYRNPDLPLSPELAAAVTRFVGNTPCPAGKR